MIPALDRALDSRDAYLRAAAAEALSCFEELPQAVHKRIRALLDDPELRHWPEIAVVVWQLGGPSDRQAAVQRLAQILKSSPELHRRSSSATALGKLGSEAVAAAKPQLLANLDHPVEYVRRPALEALWTLAARDPEVLARLQDALFRSPDLYFRALAAARMTEPGIPGATSALLKALAQDPEMPVRCSAAEALGKRGDPDAVPGLQAALADPDPQVRLSACESLVALGRTGDDTVAAVLDLLASGPSHLGGGAARLLGRLGRPSQPVILALRRLLDTDSWMEAEQALTALRVSPSGPAS